MFKKLLFVLFLSLNIQSIPYGPWLSRLNINHILNNGDRSKLVSDKVPYLGFYQLKTLGQGNASNCGRHAIKNLIFTVNSLSKYKKHKIQEALKQNFAQHKFNKMNCLLCSYLGIRNVLLDWTTDFQINNFFKDLKTGVIKNRARQLNNILPRNARKIAYGITDVISPDNSPASLRMLFYESYRNNDSNVTQILKSIVGGKKLIHMICDFKKNNKQMLAIPVRSMFHYISIVVHKINKNKFEFFILDSENSPGKAWIYGAKFLKYLIELPITRLERIKRAV